MSRSTSPSAQSDFSDEKGTQPNRDHEYSLAMAALATAARMGDFKTTKELVRLGVAKEFVMDLEYKERKKLRQKIDQKIHNIERLLSAGLAHIPSPRFIERNPFEMGLFKVNFIPGTDVAMYVMINSSALRGWNPSKDIDGCQPLHVICSLPDVPTEAVMYLLECNPIDINQKTKDNYTALIIAVLAGNYPLVKMFVERGASLDDSPTVCVDLDEVGYYYPYLKAFSPEVEDLTPLCFHFTPLEAAVFSNNEDILRYLLRKGANVNINRDLWSTYLHPIINGRRRIIERLIAGGVDVNGKDLMGATPLHTAAGEGLVDLAHVLLKNGADVNSADNLGWTPLHIACLFSKNATTEMIQLLLDAGADIEAKTRHGFTPLNLAEAGTDMFFLEFLAANVDSLGSNLKKPCMPEEDSKEEHEGMISLLLDNGANCNHQDDYLGWSALHWAAAAGDLRVTRLLVSRGALVSTRSKFNLTPQETAVYFKRGTVSVFLKTADDVGS